MIDKKWIREADGVFTKIREHAHNINNLMTVVFGRVELLLYRDDLEKKAREDLKSIQENSQKAMQMLKEISIESKDMQLKLKGDPEDTK
ncbi:MAG: hypothetical protein JW728_04575 [Candidatus Aureabacteria bacterium]|nr:hypothetical protein [Candidatus Auribacterota bacterium]